MIFPLKMKKCTLSFFQELRDKFSQSRKKADFCCVFLLVFRQLFGRVNPVDKTSSAAYGPNTDKPRPQASLKRQIKDSRILMLSGAGSRKSEFSNAERMIPIP